MSADRDPLDRETRAAFEQLRERAAGLGADLWLRELPRGAGVVYLLNGPGGQRELASLLAVSVALRDLQ